MATLRLLAALPEEAKRADIQRSLRDEVDAQLLAASHAVIKLLNALMCDPSAVFLVSPSTPPLGLGLCLQCLRSWLGTGVTCAGIHAALPQLFPAVMACFRSPNVDVVTAASDVLCTAMETKNYPRQSSENAFVFALVEGSSCA